MTGDDEDVEAAEVSTPRFLEEGGLTAADTRRLFTPGPVLGGRLEELGETSALRRQRTQVSWSMMRSQ